MKKHLAICPFLFLVSLGVAGQILLSQDFVATERFNPAAAANLESMTFKLLHRRQTFLQGDPFSTNYFSVGMPVYSGKRRWSGFNVSVLQNNSSNLNFFRKDELTVNYAAIVGVSKFSELSLGVGFNLARFSVDLGGLTTASQFLTGQGFDVSLSNGEVMDSYRSRNGTLGFGLLYKQNNKDGNASFSSGLSVLNLKTLEWGPNESTPESLLARVSAQKWIDLKKTTRLAGEFIYNYQNTISSFSVGPRMLYQIRRSYRNPYLYGDVMFLARYDSRKFVTLGTQLTKERLAVSLAYDFYFDKAINNAIEVGLSYHLKPKRRSNRRKRSNLPPYVLRRRPPASLTDTVVVIDTVTIIQEEAESGYEVDFMLDRLYILYFKFGEFNLTDQAVIYLNRVVKELEDTPSYKVILYGHTDNVGSHEDNVDLSIDRANSVRDYLVFMGLEMDRIEVHGLGEESPIAPNDTAEGRNINRRVEIKVVNDN